MAQIGAQAPFVFSFSGFQGLFVFSFSCHSARTRAGVALSGFGLSPVSAAAMVRSEKASAIWDAPRVGEKLSALRTRADWMEACWKGPPIYCTQSPQDHGQAVLDWTLVRTPLHWPHRKQRWRASYGEGGRSRALPAGGRGPLGPRGGRAWSVLPTWLHVERRRRRRRRWWRWPLRTC